MSNHRVSRWGAVLVAFALLAAACGDNDDAAPTTAAPTTAAPTTTTAAPTTTTAAPTTTTAAPGPLSGREGTVVVGKGMNADLTFDPATAFAELFVTVFGAVYNHLVSFAETPDGYDYSTLVPELATSWVSNDTATSWTFTLDPNARFHDGVPVTSEDVRWSFQRFINKQGPPSYQAGNIASIDTPDAQTVVFNLTDPDAEFAMLTTSANLVVMNSALVIANGGTDAEDADVTDTAEQWLTENSAGSGPFRMDVSDPGTRLELVRVDDYWGGPPATMERIIFTNIPEASSRVAALAQGDVDLVWTVPPHHALGLSAEDYTVLQANTNHWYYLAFTANPDNNSFIANPKVQQALKLAIDYEGLQNLCPGFPSLRAYGLAPVRLGGIDAGIEQDVPRALELLAEAGFPDGYTGDDTILFQTFHWTGFCPNFGDIVQKIALDWRAIDVNTEIQIQDAGVFFTNFRAADIDIVVSDWFPEYPSAINSAAVSFPGGLLTGRAGWDDNSDGWPGYDEMAALADDLKASVDQAERLDLLNQIETLSLESSPIHLLVEVPEWYPHVSSLTGVIYHAIHRFEPYRMGRS
jgi:peptide/nickel transport system substrate-binding protein